MTTTTIEDLEIRATRKSISLLTYAILCANHHAEVRVNATPNRIIRRRLVDIEFQRDTYTCFRNDVRARAM